MTCRKGQAASNRILDQTEYVELVFRILLLSKRIPFFRLGGPELACPEAEKVGFTANEFDEIEDGTRVFNLRFADQKHPTVSKLLLLRSHRLERVLALASSSLDSTTISGSASAVTHLTIAPNSPKGAPLGSRLRRFTDYNVWTGRLQSTESLSPRTRKCMVREGSG